MAVAAKDYLVILASKVAVEIHWVCVVPAFIKCRDYEKADIIERYVY
jgi:hypothetical protein